MINIHCSNFRTSTVNSLLLLELYFCEFDCLQIQHARETFAHIEFT